MDALRLKYFQFLRGVRVPNNDVLKLHATLHLQLGMPSSIST